MNDSPFHVTRIGLRYYEHTLPELIRQLERLNENLERHIDTQDTKEKHDGEDLHAPDA